MSNAKKILHCGAGLPTNIGNAFIDFGIRYLIRETIPNSDVIFTSNQPNSIYNRYGDLKIEQEFINIPGIITADYYVFGGSMLSVDWFRNHARLFNDLSKNNSKIIMLGVSGGDTYSDDEIAAVEEYLKQLNLFMLISRDEKTFKYYHELAEHSYNGIDSAFFLNEIFIPAKLELPEYVVLNFDKMALPKIDVKERAIRTNHALWKFSPNKIFSMWDFKMLVWSIMHHQTNLAFKINMLSDIPEDYLNIYANAKAVYSDRIHACVAALSFGTPARLYSKSDRALLFDRIGLSSIRDELVSLEGKRMMMEKENELVFLKEILG